MSISRFDLDKEPRFAVFRNKKINLLFLLRPYIMESIFAETDIRPKLDRLQKMSGNEGFVTLARVDDPRPVSQIPLWRFADCVCDVSAPRRNAESKEEGRKN